MIKGTERVFKSKRLTIYHQNLPKRRVPEHAHEEAHLFISLEASLALDVGGGTYTIGAGEMAFVGGAVDHSFAANGEGGERLILKLMGLRHRSRIAVLPLNSLLRDLCLGLFVHSEESYSETLVKLIIEIIEADLGREAKAQNKLFTTQQMLLGVRSPEFRKIISILESNLSFSLAEVAEHSGLSLRSMGRLAKTETGLTLHELHTYYRIKKAIGLMHAGEGGLLAIAFDCGYNSLSPFIENFKRWTGAKPSTFKAFL